MVVPIDNPDKNTTEHPATSGEYWYEVSSRNRGPMASIDYDEEPYRTVTSGHARAANSKPRDDRETAHALQARTLDREQLF